MKLETAICLVFALNVLWFGIAFLSFSVRNMRTARLLVAKAQRDSPLFLTVATSIQFLGGMNLALSLLSALVLFNLALFPLDAQRAIFALVFAVAHATQFYFNVPVALQNRKPSGGVWPVLEGPMLGVFATDLTLMCANGGLALVLVA